MSAVTITQPDQKELESLNIKEWGPWECEPSTFDWEYDSEEWCYLFEGKVKVKTADGDYEIKKGDLVKLAKGLKCTWEVAEKVKKVYIFK
ncbi:MAG: cupin domain-containing protein [Candidatus Omnitrophica bacterium]|nr:cupin domain-containing protein [Candidatus Omnitrophota bacterium]